MNGKRSNVVSRLLPLLGLVVVVAVGGRVLAQQETVDERAQQLRHDRT